MDKRGRKLGNVLRTSVVLISILLGVFAEGAWGAAPPSVVGMAPLDGTVNVLINTRISVQFDMTMDTGASSITLRDDYGQDVAGTVQWRTTTNPNDTLVFIPQNGLKPGRGYRYEGNGQAATGGSNWFNASFITKFSMSDVTPPTVQTTYPYDGMTDVWTAEAISLRFSEAMNPTSIANPGNITLSGDGIGGTGDYSVNYRIEDGEVEIRKNTPFTGSSTYTVTVTTKVRDLRGNPLKNQYSWSFTTGAADTTHPTVTKTIPVNGDIKVGPESGLFAFFSEEMDENTLNSTNITLYDDTASSGVPINMYMSYRDYVQFAAAPPLGLTYGHHYTVTIGTGVKDKAGNPLEDSYSWQFTMADNDTIDSDPALYDGADRDEQMGQRWPDGSRVLFSVSTYDRVTFPLFVTASTPGHDPWTLSLTGGHDYSYASSGDEGLSSGEKLVTFTIQDNALNTVTFDRSVYIFSTVPTLSSPANGATGVSTTPTFEWSYSGGDRPVYYNVAVYDGPDMGTARMVWMGAMADQGSGTHSITIPADKKLSPNKTYYWGVRGGSREETGVTYGGFWPFTTGGTPPPAPYFYYTYVRSDDFYNPPPPQPNVQGWFVARVGGVSPADIAELKVTRPGGFQYIFTEDDLLPSQQMGHYYMPVFPNSLADGTYTFTLTDSAGRTVTATNDFTFASVPRVDYNTMLPAHNTYLNTTTPTLSWTGVGEGYSYRIAIWDWNSNERPVFMSDYTQDTSITVPSGALLLNTPYHWRVDVYDPSDNNRSRSNSRNFSTGSDAAVADIAWVNFFNENNYYGGQMTRISADVTGVLPNQVTSFSASGPDLNYSFLPTDIMYNLATPGGSMYNIGLPGSPTGGDYTLSLVTSRGNDSLERNVTLALIPIVDQASMSPANNTYLGNLTPTFTWSAEEGGPRYYRVLIMDWRQAYVIYISPKSADLSFTLPAGVLKPGRPYTWRVEVYDDSTPTGDNRSTSAWNCFTTPRKRGIIDLDGDGKTDITIWRPGEGFWYAVSSKDGSILSQQFGAGYDPYNDKPVPGDYDGDGKTDIAIWRPGDGYWLTISSKDGSILSQQFGAGYAPYNDKPVPGDYDGDGKTDYAVWRPGDGYWYIINSKDGSITSQQFGAGYAPYNDKPVPGDYDGDGKTDIAIWREADGYWYIINSKDGSITSQQWGTSGDVLVPGDYDGDGKTDIAVWRPSDGYWYIINSKDGSITSQQLGAGYAPYNDVPVPGDYDGDGKTDIAVWRPAEGYWYIINSKDGSVTATQWGAGYAPYNDKPITQ